MDNNQNENSPQIEEQKWQYNSGQLMQQDNIFSAGTSNDSDNAAPANEIKWSASEFTQHEKNGGWYSMLIAGAIIVSVIVFIITREIISIVAIAVLAVAIGIYGALKPRTLEYFINHDGISVGDKLYRFDQFKSFALIEGTAIPSIQLMPQKKLAIPLSIYLDPASLDDVIDVLGNYLPFEQKKRDFVDRLSSKLKF